MKTYREAGVDISRGDRFAAFISRLKSPALGTDIGSFAAAVPFDPGKCRRPVLLTTCDGVGTKILVARRLGRYRTIGIDLVAMCANDLLVCGAKPLAFQDYIACGRIVEKVLRDVVRGILAGCEQAGCALTGGETAEMPDMYGEQDIDLAGFCVGIAEEDAVLPHRDRIRQGDAVLGLPSSGVHSNGLSLARKVVTEDREWEELLVPTRIYAREMAALTATGRVLAAAHVTGGGLEGNLSRVIPPRLEPRLTYAWPRPWIFEAVQRKGGIPEEEMRRVFNLGIGMAIVVPRADASEIVSLVKGLGVEAFEIGSLEEK